MTLYLILAFAAGFTIGLFVIGLVSGAGREDAFRAGLAAGREQLQRETMQRVWDELDSYGGTDLSNPSRDTGDGLGTSSHTPEDDVEATR